ncbi:MAG TPA: FHA domain-containing protein [Actinomycetota bacterium]|nr:FHA domain-containing protein [Actinomycetota bacterium]
MYCTRCGHPNKDEARYCANCGAALQEETTLGITPIEIEGEGADEFPFPEDELEPGQALLLVKHGPNAGSTFMIENEVTSAGRSPQSDVFLDDITVSRKHAEIRRQGDGFYIHDLGSLNGSYVNRERVDVTKLAAGDEVQIGKFRLVFFVRE